MTEYVHPETGELLATEQEWRAAIAALEEALSRIYGPLWKLRDGYAKRFPPAELPARRYRSEKQEQVARCPRCGGRLKMGNEWTQEQLNNAMTYGVCLVCMEPQEMRKTVTDKDGHTNTHFELIRPCGHTEGQIDAKLDEMESERTSQE